MNHFSLRFCVLSLVAVLSLMTASAQDAGVKSILQPSATVCGGNVLPVVVVGNDGAIDLDYFRVNYELDGSVVANYTWVGLLQPGETDTLTFPALSLGLGVYTLRVFTSDPGFLMDVNPANDTLSRTFEVTEAIGVDPPFKADFDDAGFPYDGYIVNNPDAALGWERTEAASFSGSGSLFINNYNYNGIGQEDEITLPGINLTKLDKAGLSFYLSYAQYGPNSGFADTLEIYVSGDCGLTFDRVYQKYGADLATAPATTSEYFPRGSFDWRKEWVDLSDYFEATFLVVRFRHVSNYENNLFLDRIRVEKIFALDAEDELQAQSALSVVVNQSAGQIDVEFGGGSSGTSDLVLSDLHGRTLYRINRLSQATRQRLSIPAGDLSPGVYYLRLEGEHPQSRALIW